MERLDQSILVVIAEVEIIPKEAGWMTRDRSFNEILREYAKHFRYVLYIGPSDEKVTNNESAIEGVSVASILYDRGAWSRLSFLSLAGPRIAARLREVWPDPGALVQVRVPSVFSVKVLAHLPTERVLARTAYIAGEWDSSFASSHPFPGARIAGSGLQRLQDAAIRSYIKVSAGVTIAMKYGGGDKCHPYLSTSHRDVRPRCDINEGRRIIFVGRLERRKRITDLLNAVDQLHREGIMVSLAVVGDGVERPRAEGVLRGMANPELIRMVGRLEDNAALEQQYREADVLVLPSVSEGTPKVLPEAMSYGVIPVACAGVGSNDSIIESQHNGMLYPPTDVDGLVGVLRGIHDMHIDARARMVEHCLEYARAHTLQEEVAKLWKYVEKQVHESLRDDY